MPSLRTRWCLAAALLVAPVAVEADERPPRTLEEVVAPLSVDLANALRKRGIRSIEVDALERTSFGTTAHERLRRVFVRMLGRLMIVRDEKPDAILRLYTIRRPGGYDGLCLVKSPEGHSLGKCRLTWRNGDLLDRAVLQGATFDATIDAEGDAVEPSRARVRRALDEPSTGWVNFPGDDTVRASLRSPFSLQLVPGRFPGNLGIDGNGETFDLGAKDGFRVVLHNNAKYAIGVDLSIDGVNVWDGRGQWSDVDNSSLPAWVSRRRMILVEPGRRVLVHGWPTGTLKRSSSIMFGTQVANNAGTYGQISAVIHPVDHPKLPAGSPSTVAMLQPGRVTLVSRNVSPIPAAAISLRFARPGVTVRESYLPTSTTVPAPIDLAALDDVPPPPPDSGRGFRPTTGGIRGVVRLGFPPPNAPPGLVNVDPFLKPPPPEPPTPLERLQALDGKSGYDREDLRFLRRSLLDDEPEVRRFAERIVAGAREKDLLAVVLPVFDEGTEAEQLRVLDLVDDPLTLVLTHPEIGRRLERLVSAKDPLLRVRGLRFQAYDGGRREQVVEPLAALLSSEDAVVRRYAVEGLGRCGPAAESVVPKLIERINDEDATVTAAAVEAIRRITKQ